MSRFIDIFGDNIGMVFERDVFANGLTMEDVEDSIKLGEICECKMEIPEKRAWGRILNSVITGEKFSSIPYSSDYERYYTGSDFEYGVFVGSKCQKIFGLVTQEYFSSVIESVLVDKEIVIKVNDGSLIVRPLKNKEYLDNPYEYMLANAFNDCPLKSCDYTGYELIDKLISVDKPLDFDLVIELVFGVDEKNFLRRCKDASK